MKTSPVIISAIAGLGLGLLIHPLNGQTTDKKKTADSSGVAVEIHPTRRCLNWDERKARFMEQKKTNDALKSQGKAPRRLGRRSMGNNPQEGQYRREMERLLGIEIDNINRAMTDAQNKHKELTELYPKYKKYQQIIIRYTPGAYIDGSYVASRTAINFHYDDKGKINCLVLENRSRNVYQTSRWTNKYVRLYNPYIQFMELETFRQNYRLMSRLENTSAEIQLKSMRLMYKNIRAAVYIMDVMIARFHHQTGKQAEYQVD